MATSEDGFQDTEAKREQVPVLIGLVGPSGSGKTYSALRLAAGIQRVCGGEIFLGDTESHRACHYAPPFNFRHVPFEKRNPEDKEPFSSARYLAFFEYCLKKGAKTVIVDSMSHEHEGAGGFLDLHETEMERRAGNDEKRREKIKIGCWIKPKRERQKLINGILQMPINVILCFRAKEKLKIVTGQDPVQLGYMPIAGEEFIWEMTLKCLLLPGSVGTPVWHSDFAGEKAMIKLPEQFRQMFSGDSPPQLTEDIGEQLARWAAGGVPATTATTRPSSGIDDLCAAYDSCDDAGSFERLERDRKAGWSKFSNVQQKELIKASSAAAARVKEMV